MIVENQVVKSFETVMLAIKSKHQNQIKSKVL